MSEKNGKILLAVVALLAGGTSACNQPTAQPPAAQVKPLNGSDTPIIIADDGVGNTLVDMANAITRSKYAGIHFRHRNSTWTSTGNSGSAVWSTALDTGVKWLIADPDHEDLKLPASFSVAGLNVSIAASAMTVTETGGLTGTTCSNDPKNSAERLSCSNPSSAISVDTNSVGSHQSPAYGAAGASGNHYFLFAPH